MSLSPIQISILRLLAAHRDPESYVAGAAALNRNAPRSSSDIDIFHSREERVTLAAASDAIALETAGYRVRWIRRLPAIYTASVSAETGDTRLEWIVDSDFRFFPVLPDETFGFVLHPVDLATNKAMAAAGRRELRDIVDLVTVHDTILSLGAVLWAAVDKSPGYTPEGLIAEIRRNSIYPAAEWRALATTEPLDPATTLAKLRVALDDAEAFVARMPTDKLGMLFLEAGNLVQPDPGRLDIYQTHTGTLRGHWPASAEITAAMLAHYNKKNEWE